ncbi:hypothetical protein CPB83DRAFT_595347 [Crepidotus variabilis]|uniref:F-box domain-containing protein n=1 Tax=Crepidotus variabilis TaxID=179855 RepID=A0A9P6E980_9AGAR|nr:hypothetical protein CPB83DRAFT_595347 [Crepidotus variabilis]
MPSLPHEIIDSVLSHFSPSRQSQCNVPEIETLTSCALASRAFHDSALPHIFKRVEFVLRGNPQTFVKRCVGFKPLIEANKAIGNSVKILIIEGCEKSLLLLSEVLSLLPNVSHFELGSVVKTMCWVDFDEQTTAAVSSFWKSNPLTHIQLQQVEALPAFEIASCRYLQSLQLHHADLLPCSNSTKLLSLTLAPISKFDCAYSPQALESLAEMPGLFLELEELAFTIGGIDTVYALNRLLENAPNVRILSLRHSYGGLYHTDGQNTPDLTPAYLRILSIHYTLPDNLAFPPSILQLLKPRTNAASPIEELTVEMIFEDITPEEFILRFDPQIGWAKLDDLLSDGHYCNLSKVQISVALGLTERAISNSELYAEAHSNFDVLLPQVRKNVEVIEFDFRPYCISEPSLLFQDF